VDALDRPCFVATGGGKRVGAILMIRAPNALAMPTMGQPQYAMPVVFNERSLERLEPVNPALRQLMIETERRASERGIDFEVTEGMRDRERQARLVAEGASRTMNSYHLNGNAVDIHLLNPDGSANWDFEAYQPVAEIAKEVAAEMGIPDFVWGGDWESFRDGVHFQIGGAPATSQPNRGSNVPPYNPPPSQGPSQTWASNNAPMNALAMPGQNQLAEAQSARRQQALNALTESLRRPIYTNVMSGGAPR
jgi:peptidoglycan LD-endopeptidase CwlK